MAAVYPGNVKTWTDVADNTDYILDHHINDLYAEVIAIEVYLNSLIGGGATLPFVTMPYVGTAPVVVSGSNANGSYIKFSDGTMICWNSIAFNSQMMTAIGSIFQVVLALPDYPIAFYLLPSCVKDMNITGVAYAWLGNAEWSGNQTVTAPSQVTVFTPTIDSPSTIRIHYIAIGRWKA